MKKLSQHLQYRHPHIGPQERKKICLEAKVAKGRGSIKRIRVTPQQPTLFNVLGQHEVSDDDVWRVDQCDEVQMQKRVIDDDKEKTDDEEQEVRDNDVWRIEK